MHNIKRYNDQPLPPPPPPPPPGVSIAAHGFGDIGRWPCKLLGLGSWR